jgi:superfamily II DNA or RNA helicase
MRLPDHILAKLRPYQGEPATLVTENLAHRQNVVDLSPTGTGKTYVAAAALAVLDKSTLVVCPKSAITPWRRAAEHFEAHFSRLNYDMIRTGRTPFGRWQYPLAEKEKYYVCKNCQCHIDEKSDPCYCRPDGEHELEEKEIAHNYGKFFWHDAIDTLVFDEVHRCSGDDTLQSRMLIAAKRQGKRVLALSATAACSPLQFRALGYVLGLHTLKEKKDPYGSPYYASGVSYEQWAAKYKCRWTTWGGFQWLEKNDEEQRKIMVQIRKEIVPRCGVYVDIDNIPDFPTRSIHCQCYDIEAANEVDNLYEQMAAPLAELEERKLQDKDPDCAFTTILRARQKIELLKVPVFAELAQDYIAKGCHVALFLNFQETIRQLAERLKCDAIIDGSPLGVKNRDATIDGFEKDIYPAVLVNTGAGAEAIGLRDLLGLHPRVGLVSPCFSARTMSQLFGRLPRDGSKSHSTYYVVFAADTIEEDIAVAAGKKLDNVDSLNLTNADLTPTNLLEARSRKRKKKTVTPKQKDTR